MTTSLALVDGAVSLTLFALLSAAMLSPSNGVPLYTQAFAAGSALLADDDDGPARYAAPARFVALVAFFVTDVAAHLVENRTWLVLNTISSYVAAFALVAATFRLLLRLKASAKADHGYASLVGALASALLPLALALYGDAASRPMNAPWMLASFVAGRTSDGWRSVFAVAVAAFYVWACVQVGANDVPFVVLASVQIFATVFGVVAVVVDEKRHRHEKELLMSMEAFAVLVLVVVTVGVVVAFAFTLDERAKGQPTQNDWIAVLVAFVAIVVCVLATLLAAAYLAFSHSRGRANKKKDT